MQPSPTTHSANGEDRKRAVQPGTDGILRPFRGLMKDLTEMRAGTIVDPAFRRAALNLMEDVAEAQRATAAESVGRELAEHSLHESEEQFRRAIEQAPIPVIMHAEDGEVMQISHTWSELTGFDAREMPTFEGWLNKAYGYGADSVRERMRAVFAGDRKTDEIEFEITTRRGERRHWIFSTSAPGRLRDGRRFAVGMAVDVTERKRTEAALRASEERLRTLFESMSEAFVIKEAVLDPAGRIVDFRFIECNPAFSSQTGLGDPKGRTVRELIPGLEPIFFQSYENVIATGEPTRFETFVGSLNRWLGVSASRLGGANSHRIAVLFRDVTERKRGEEALRETDRRKSEFLAMLGHELRNPLTAIKGGLKLLQSERARPESRAAALPIVVHQAAHMERLIDDVLDLARLERGKFQVRPARIDLQQTLASAIEMVRAAAQAKACEIRTQFPADPIEVTADSVRLTQVLVNLLTNAVKFSAHGGKVDLIVERQEGYAIIRVRDHGVGIAPDLLSQVFEAFVQANQSLGKADDGLGLGLGLGLTIGRELITLHGGTLEAFSEGKNRGSEFVVRLPLHPPGL